MPDEDDAAAASPVSVAPAETAPAAATAGGAETVGGCVRRSSPLLDDDGSTSCTSDGSFAFDWLARDTARGELNGAGMMRVMDGLSSGEPASVRHRFKRPSWLFWGVRSGLFMARCGRSLSTI